MNSGIFQSMLDHKEIDTEKPDSIQMKIKAARLYKM